MEHIRKTAIVIEKKSQAIPVLEEEERNATMRNKVAQKTSQMRITVGELKEELSWSYVREKREVSRLRYKPGIPRLMCRRS